MSDLLTAVPLLESPRLRLRSISRADLEALYAMHADPRSMRFWSFPPWTRMQQAQEWFEQRQQLSQREETWPWAITRREDEAVIGVCTLFAVSRTNYRAEIGYLLHPDHWGQGYAQEALRAMLRYALDGLQLRRIEADIDPRNAASCTLVERLGFRREGLLRERWHVGGEVADTALYGLLAREFIG